MTRVHYPAIDQVNTIVADLNDWELKGFWERFLKRFNMVTDAHPNACPPTKRTTEPRALPPL